MAQELNQIDKLRTAASGMAEQKCRRLKVGNVPWSPDIQASINKIWYYRVCLQKYKHNMPINSRTLQKLCSRQTGMKVDNAIDADIQLKLAFIEYRANKPKSSTIQYEFLHELAKAKAEATGEDTEKVLKQLQTREEQRRLGQKLKQLKGTFRKGISAVIAPDETGTWKR